MAVHTGRQRLIVGQRPEWCGTEPLQNRFCLWPLQGQECLRLTAIVGPGSRSYVLRYPVEIPGNIGGIDYQEKAVSGQTAHGQIIEQPSGLITQSAVLQLVDLQSTHVIQRQVLYRGLSPGAAYFDLAHMADIEEPGVRAHCLMLFENAYVQAGQSVPLA